MAQVVEKVDPSRVEVQLLLSLSMAELMPRFREQANELLGHSGAFDSRLFGDLARQHRVAPLVAANLASFGRGYGPVDAREATELSDIARMNAQRNRQLLDEAVTLIAALTKAGVPTAVRKGLPLAYRVHGRIGARMMKDIDLLINRRDAVRVREVLESIGVKCARSDDQGGIDAWPRRAVSALMVGGLTLPGDAGMRDVGVVEIGLVTALFDRQSGYELPVDTLLSTCVVDEIEGSPVVALDDAHFFIDLCAHFWKDAKSLASVGWGADLQLYRFCDVAGYALRLSRR